MNILNKERDYLYCVISFSKKGGGVSFAQMVANTFPHEETIFLYSSVNNSLMFNVSSGEKRPMRVPHAVLTINWWYFMTRTIFEIWQSLRASKIALLTMPHPVDMLVIMLAKLARTPIAMVVHDARPHLGEKWPTSKGIKRRIKSVDLVICLSSFTASLLQPKQEKLIVCAFPFVPEFPIAAENYVLMCGRIKAYQSIDLICQAWASIENQLPNNSLTIAGESVNMCTTPHPRIQILNKWLEDEEMKELIRKSSAVVLPYLEASQSGIFMQAVGFGVPVVVTPLPGLIEQARKYESAVISGGFTPDLFGIAIRDGIEKARGGKFTEDKPSILNALEVFFRIK